MTTESLEAKARHQAIVSKALSEITAIGDRLGKEPSELDKAIENINLLEELRNLPSVQEYLTATNKIINIVDSGIRRYFQSLDVTPEGYELQWRDYQKNVHGDLKKSTLFSEEIIRKM